MIAEPYPGCSVVELLGQHLVLTPQRALYWNEAETLVLSDVCLGKSNHLHQEGIPVPETASGPELDLLIELVDAFGPKQIVFTGDLFHSGINQEWTMFAAWTDAQPNIRKILTRGKHDVLHPEAYRSAGVELHDVFTQGPFSFSHEHPDEAPGYVFTGHTHPGIEINTPDYQIVQLPCYCFSKRGCMLPAFGNPAQLAVLKPHKGNGIYAIAGKEVICMSPLQATL